ncbi:hypothetical protein P7C70_g5817, partial [Phenoliferia sp. Uapishka_3]
MSPSFAWDDPHDSASFTSSSSSDRTSMSSASSYNTGARDSTPLSSPSVFMPTHSFNTGVDNECFAPGFAPLPVLPAPPSPPQPRRERVSAVATFAAESICFLWFDNSRIPSKHQLVPTEKFLRFCHDVLATTQVSHSVVILALLFIYRLKHKNQICGAPGSEFRLCVTALMMANKVLDDNTYTAKTWSDVSSLELKPLVAGELEFLSGIDYQCHVSEQDFGGWIKLLEGHVAARKEQIAESKSSGKPRRLHQGQRVSLPPRELLVGLGFGPVDGGMARDSSRRNRSIAHVEYDQFQAAPRQTRPLPSSLANFSFPSTPSFDSSRERFIPPAFTSYSTSCSPITSSTQQSQTPPIPIRHPRLSASKQPHAHTRSSSDAPYRPLPPPPTLRSSASKRSAADAELLDSSSGKRLAPSSTWLSKSLSAGASPAPPKSVYMMPRGGGPVYIHPGHGHRMSSSASSSISSLSDFSPPPPPLPHSSYFVPQSPSSSEGFRHLADGHQPSPYRLSMYRPESLAFYSLAAGQKQGVPRWTSTDPEYKYQYTPTPHPLSSFVAANEGCGGEYWDGYAPPPTQQPLVGHHYYSKYANAGDPGVMWAGRHA